MKVTTDKIENRRAYLTIEMEPAEVAEGLNKAYGRLVKKANIPGFRKGKAPRPILEQYLGKEALLDDAIDHMASEAVEKAVKEQDLKPIARPEVNLEKREPVTYKLVVSLEPVVKLGNYSQIRLSPPQIEVKQKDTEDALEQLRHDHSIWEPVERQVNSRDMVIMDIESNIGTQPYINQKDAEFQVIKEADYPIKGFAEQIIGLKRGETKEFKLSFAQDYPRAELAGKEVSFKVNIKEIKQEKLPELNDDLAKQVNPDFKSVEELRSKVTDGLKIGAEVNAKRDFEQKVVDTVVGMSQVEFPLIMEEEEIDYLIRQQMQRWRIDEKGMDEYLKNIKKTPEQLREELRPVAIRSLKQSLVLAEVARSEKIEVEKSDLQNEVEGMTRDVSDERKDQLVQFLNTPQAQVNIASSIATRRTVDRLVEIAKSPVETVEKAENVEAAQAESAQKEVKE